MGCVCGGGGVRYLRVSEGGGSVICGSVGGGGGSVIFGSVRSFARAATLRKNASEMETPKLSVLR